jgi:hypothetical protein
MYIYSSWSKFFDNFAPKFGQNIIESFECGDYQGEVVYLLQDEGGKYSVISYTYGSCSECDCIMGMESESELEEYAGEIFNHTTPLDQWVREVTSGEDFLFSHKMAQVYMLDYLKNHKII